MKRNNVVTTIVCVCVPLFTSAAFGAEKQIKKSELPSAVQKTADEQSAGATVRGYAKDKEDGKLEYEVQLILNGHSKDVTIDPSGKLLEVEEEVAPDSLPANVREGLEKKAGKGKLGKVESITKQGVLVAYEGHVVTGGKKSEVQVGPEGQTLEHEE